MQFFIAKKSLRDKIFYFKHRWVVSTKSSLFLYFDPMTHKENWPSFYNEPNWKEIRASSQRASHFDGTTAYFYMCRPEWAEMLQKRDWPWIVVLFKETAQRVISGWWSRSAQNESQLFANLPARAGGGGLSGGNLVSLLQSGCPGADHPGTFDRGATGGGVSYHNRFTSEMNSLRNDLIEGLVTVISRLIRIRNFLMEALNTVNQLIDSNS